MIRIIIFFTYNSKLINYFITYYYISNWRTSRQVTARSIASPLAPFGGVSPQLMGGFTRSQNNAGVVWNQKSALGQSAGMGMMMEPLRKSKRKAQLAVPRDTEVRVIPLNEYGSAYSSTRPSLTHIGQPLSRVT